ncbi:sugar phosphate isomerase/epimerase family protein [Gilvimarinus sp. SDUM040013]|uniref:Sugar phosphate isomerase/epimerase family protein n=1 Tax=Gilvimarinus gilvus TaxID=3058038 RepID=A0ABU4RVW9_9GAMM|nr:sugar phosphate isomerase/epimerase family protein [Gilvimarinus sp. SDUM040013]MDO3386758.1 sugar phosphate isomerase/epimerase family protein [Gilvimarinus sp. SDUM040013]MDX6848312.1 sugar phosphate isomerase/epimerase family protein [Gilvimarinus sp. SDUM040013]
MSEYSRRQCLAGLGSLLAGSVLASNAVPVLAAPDKPYFFDISLAQWSLNKSFFDKSLSPLDFPAVARTSFDIGAVEYVNQFFMDKAKDTAFLNELKQRALDHDVESLLIMIDGEGDLSVADEKRRKQAVLNHHKWVDAAAQLGCHSIRVNLHGSGSAEDWHRTSVESMAELGEYGADRNIKILVENHGGYSSHGAMLAAVLKEVDSPFCGSMPDFGNFCYQRASGDLWDSPCVKQYDIYQGVADLMPYAGAVSAKAFRFDKNGNEPDIDFHRIFKLVKAAGYTGHVGIEYEGHDMSAEDGIRATKHLLERVRKELA